MKTAFRWAFLLLVVVPCVAWFVVRPVRVVAPSVLGMYCVSAAICVENRDKLPEATSLYREALSFVGRSVGPITGEPLVVFCSTRTCAEGFGLGARSAVTVGTLGTVIGPEAWKPHYVRHELIHHLQGQQFGVLRGLFMPSWLMEGMAYSLSEDPRSRLAEPWQRYRDEFNTWLSTVDRKNMWPAARGL